MYDSEIEQLNTQSERQLPNNDEFLFSVYSPVSLRIGITLADSTPYSNAKVTLLNSNGEQLQHMVSNTNGEVRLHRTLHATDSVIGIFVSAIGFPSDTLWISPWGIDHVTLSPQSYATTPNIAFKKKTSLGLPEQMVADISISSELLSDINNAFPERSRVDIDHPEYIHHGVERELYIKEDSADVWVTFIHEGAGYRNSFGYFTYQNNEPPASAASLNLIPIFPNASYSGSGGGLSTGNTVHIGKFAPETKIGFWVIANGWNSTAIDWSKPLYYSMNDFNPESTDENRHHLASLFHPDHNMLILAFEDLNRDSQGCDHDFNDIVFTATWNPIPAISLDNFFEVPNTIDSDNDGITDNNDTYPTDPNKAFDIYTPAENAFGLLAFEDLFPKMGDYDFNDVVLSYNVKEVTNASLEVASIEGTLIARASGAHLENGFAFSFGQVPQPSSWSITGTYTTLESYFEQGPSGELIFIIADNFKHLFRGEPTGMINTSDTKPHIDGDTIQFVINFAVPIPLAIPPYNPFIFRTGGEELEVHLPYYPPSYRFKYDLFGRKDDASTPENGRYFLNNADMPWAVHTGPHWIHPKETRSIGVAYQYFNSWVSSGGSNYRDWERNGLNATALYLNDSKE